MLRDNLILRTAHVPAGRHIVELRYYPPRSVVAGLLVSTAAAVLGLGFVFVPSVPTGGSAAGRASPPASGS